MRDEIREAIQDFLGKRRAAGAPLDIQEIKIKERAHVEKFDMTGDTPQLVEYLIVEDGRVVERTRPMEGS